MFKFGTSTIFVFSKEKTGVFIISRYHLDQACHFECAQTSGTSLTSLVIFTSISQQYTPNTALIHGMERKKI